MPSFAPSPQRPQSETSSAPARPQAAASRRHPARPPLQRQPAIGNQALARRLSGAPPAGVADALPRPLRAGLERALSADFSDVRVRTESARAREWNALAFAQGSEIHVAPGQWAPQTAKGRELLGHELGHVLQQRAGRVGTTGYLAGERLNHDPALEREADAYGARAAPAAAPWQADAFAPPVSARAGVPGGVVQRRGDDPIHDPLLDEFSNETGIPRDQASQHDPLYEVWLDFRTLDRLSVDVLLDELTDRQARGQLVALIAGAQRAPASARVKVAMDVVQQTRGPAANAATALATIAASALSADEQLAMSQYVRVPRTRAADLRAAVAPGGAAAVPNADLGRDIGYELDPSSRPAPVPPPPKAPQGGPAPPPLPPPVRIPWDGTTGALGEAAAHAKMQAEMFTAFDAYLTAFRPSTVAALARPRVAFNAPAAAPGAAAPAPTGVVDIANQARAVLEKRYATSMDAAASSASVIAGRAARTTAPGAQNIFDSSSEADRITMTGSPDLASGQAWWLFENDTPGAAGAAGSRVFATDILAKHHYSTQDAGAEKFRWDVAKAYAAASTLAPNNKRQLIDYRLTVSERGQSGITLQSSFNPGLNPKRSELLERWQIFGTATHESLHARTHPAFTAADQGRGTMKEGFTEMFAVATLNTDVLPDVRAGKLEPLRRTVEGAQSPTPMDNTLITNRVTPPQYVPRRAQAERIRDGGTPTGGTAHTGVGESAVRAAYFEGHVEYIGLAPAGTALAGLAAPGASPLTRIPTGLSGLDELARRSGVARATIEKDNPGITDALPASAVLAGCREHIVVAAETRANIAAQNGVSEADLVSANPDIALDAATGNWPAQAAGTRIMIPVH